MLNLPPSVTVFTLKSVVTGNWPCSGTMGSLIKKRLTGWSPSLQRAAIIYGEYGAER